VGDGTRKREHEQLANRGNQNSKHVRRDCSDDTDDAAKEVGLRWSTFSFYATTLREINK